jgi:cardiolipin synthase
MTETYWKITTRAEDAWEEMLIDCAQAQTSIDIEQFIFQDDAIGKRFFEIILQKARAGLHVRLLLDAARCFSLMNSSRAAELEQAGALLQFFNPISPWRVKHFSWWPFRDHRKLLIVDSSIGHIGGVGINAEMQGWRDTNVRIVGPVVKDMETSFRQMWRNAVLGKFCRFKKPSVGADGFQILTNSPHVGQRFMYRRLLAAMRTSRQYIYLTTPYFIPDIRFFRIMRKAARRGVDVRILLPDQSDHPFIDIAAGSYFGLALKSGVRFYKYRGAVIHAKTGMVDDMWGTVGSMNLDSQGFVWSHEANVISSDRVFVQELKKQFLRDLSLAEEVIEKNWKERPRSQKILELLSWPFHKFL